MKRFNEVLSNHPLTTLPPIALLLCTLLLAGCKSAGENNGTQDGMPRAEASVDETFLPTSFPTPASNPQFPSFPDALSPSLPRNIDQPFFESLKVDSLTRAGLYNDFQVSRAKRLMDIFSWQTFLAMNWPVSERSLLFQADTTYQEALDCPDATITDSCDLPAGLRAQFARNNANLADSVQVHPVEPGELWEVRNYFTDYWHPYLIRKEDGRLSVYSQQLPTPNLGDDGPPRWTTWKESDEVFRKDGAAPDHWYAREWPHHFPNALKAAHEDEEKSALWVTHKAGILDDSDQAGSGIPLWDQNGNMVFYEVRLNKPSFDLIVQDTLYNLNGQIKFAKSGNERVFFNWGNSQEANPFALGSMELKMAWKIMDEANGDIPERFITKEALIGDSTGSWTKHQVGLVGFHVTHKTKTHQSWIWSTFEHVDNLIVDDLFLSQNQHGRFPLKPLFHDIGCATCPVNVKPPTDSSGTRKTQVLRVMPIPESTANLNREVRQKIQDAAPDSKLQYYELVGTQWPAAGTEDNGPILPFHMVNTVMETYMQYGNREIKGRNGVELRFESASCISCHSKAKFATGCSIDASGNIQIQYSTVPHGADYSWLLNQASWYKPDQLARALCDQPA